MPNALIKFTQNAPGPGAGGNGHALIGVAGTSVLVANVDNTNVSQAQFELLYVPPGSGLTTGVKQAYSATLTWSFTPDVSECFVVKLRVKDVNGNESVDVRVFGVLEASGRLILPPFVPGSAMNFAGQLAGWQPYLREYQKVIDGYAIGQTSIQGLRLCGATNTPISTSDIASTSTIYFTPFLHGSIALFDGSGWVVRTTAEISLALSALTSGKNYDVFAYWTGSAVALELSAAWTNDTTRANALARQNGVLVKSGTPTRRYVGTIRTISTTTTADRASQRFIWNLNNRVKHHLSVVEATNSWAYTSTVFRAVNGNANNAVEYVTGDVSAIEAKATAATTNSVAGRIFSSGVGVDSTSVNSAQVFGADSAVSPGSKTCIAEYYGRLAAGYHKLTWLENGNTGMTFYGTAGSSVFQTGLVAALEG